MAQAQTVESTKPFGFLGAQDSGLPWGSLRVPRLETAARLIVQVVRGAGRAKTPRAGRSPAPRPAPPAAHLRLTFRLAFDKLLQNDRGSNVSSKKNNILVFGLVVLALSASVFGDPQPYLGRWALSLPNGAGWLEVHQEQGYLDASILWYGGSVVPVDNVYVEGQQLIVTRNRQVVRRKEEAGKPGRTQIITTRLEMQVQGDQMTGKALDPNRTGDGVTVTEFTGKKIPPVPAAPDPSKLKFGSPITLFNGKDLTGWKLTNPQQVNGWSAKDGVLVNNPAQQEGKPHISYGNLRTEAAFEDFNLKLEVSVPKGSNSGVYLRGIYEVQVADTYGQKLDPHNMGAVYSRITPTVAAEKPAGEWESLDMTLADRHITVILNGQKIIDNQPVLGVTGGALTADEFSPGPIYLQGDHGTVSYRNIVLRPIVK